MSDEVQAKAVEGEETKSIAEREEAVLENAGVDTKQENGIYKVDLSKPKQDAVQEQSTDEVPVRDESETSQEVVEEIRDTEEPAQEEQILQEITNEENEQVQSQSESEIPQQTAEATEQEKEEINLNLPENIQKVVDFMNETGGTLEDYVRLNADYSNIDENSLLREYYKSKKSHLSNEEIDFLIDDKFSFDEDIDDERDIKRKKLAFKEEVAEARSYLENLKSNYYQEVKLNSRLTPDQQKAVDFFNRYNNEQSELQKLQEKFKAETNNVFNQEFKGFDFKVGDKKFRFNVKDVESTKAVQSDVLTAFSDYINPDNTLKDAKGYHKALFTARNADAIANHFYEQGKADAIRNVEAQSKNINMDPRKSGVIEAGGSKVRVVSGDDSSKLRIKLKK